MKKFLKCTIVLLLLFTSFFTPAYTQETSSKNLSFSISPYTTVLYGHQGEYVFAENSANKKAILSYLEWDMKAAVMLGYELNISSNNNHFLKYNAEYGLPLVSGKMQDSDWLNNNKYGSVLKGDCPVTIILTDDQYNIKTNYSVSDESIKLNLRKEITIGHNFYVSDYMTITPIFSLEYSYIYFEAINGYKQYTNSYRNGYFNESYETAPKENMQGKAISLKKHSFLSWAGFSTTINPINKFSYTIDFSICPYAYIFSLDYHWARNDLFIDIMHGTNCAIKSGIELTYDINSKNKIFLKSNIMISDVIEGITNSSQITKRYSMSTSQNSTSGCDFEYATFTLGYTHKF